MASCGGETRIVERVSVAIVIMYDGVFISGGRPFYRLHRPSQGIL